MNQHSEDWDVEDTFVTIGAEEYRIGYGIDVRTPIDSADLGYTKWAKQLALLCIERC